MPYCRLSGGRPPAGAATPGARPGEADQCGPRRRHRRRRLQQARARRPRQRRRHALGLRPSIDKPRLHSVSVGYREADLDLRRGQSRWRAQLLREQQGRAHGAGVRAKDRKARTPSTAAISVRRSARQLGDAATTAARSDRVRPSINSAGSHVFVSLCRRPGPRQSAILRCRAQLRREHPGRLTAPAFGHEDPEARAPSTASTSAGTVPPRSETSADDGTPRHPSVDMLRPYVFVFPAGDLDRSGRALWLAPLH